MKTKIHARRRQLKIMLLVGLLSGCVERPHVRPNSQRSPTISDNSDIARGHAPLVECTSLAGVAWLCLEHICCPREPALSRSKPASHKAVGNPCHHHRWSSLLLRSSWATEQGIHSVAHPSGGYHERFGFHKTRVHPWILIMKRSRLKKRPEPSTPSMKRVMCILGNPLAARTLRGFKCHARGI